VFTRALHLSLSWARSTQSTPSHPLSLRSIHTSDVPRSKSQVHFLALRSIIQRISSCPRFLMNFRNRLIFLRWGVVSPTPNPQAGGPPLVGCPRLLIQYIRSYPPYLEAVSSIRKLRTRHAVVTWDPHTHGFVCNKHG
jgi:hypothetical protein